MGLEERGIPLSVIDEDVSPLSILAQTTTTVPAEPEFLEPSRPISDYLIDVLGLDPDGTMAGFLSTVVEPLIQITLIILAAWLVLRLVRRLTRRFIARAKRREPSGATDEGPDPFWASRRNKRLEALSAVLYSILALVVWSAAFLVILATTFGVDLTPFLAGAGIIGIALGFGAQDLIKDFVSGVFMLIEDQYGVGDVIDVGDAVGVVEQVSLRTTKLRDVNGTLWHFPNGELRHVGNMSQDWSRALVDIGVGYGSDIDEAAEVMRLAAEDMAGEKEYRGLFLAPPEIWGVESMGPDAVVIRLVIKTVPGQQAAITRELRRRVKLALDRAGIEMPFSQRKMWMGTETQDERVITPPHPTTPSEDKAILEDGDEG
jgi:small conductance mechanosensitive channel